MLWTTQNLFFFLSLTKPGQKHLRQSSCENLVSAASCEEASITDDVCTAGLPAHAEAADSSGDFFFFFSFSTRKTQKIKLFRKVELMQVTAAGEDIKIRTPECRCRWWVCFCLDQELKAKEPENENKRRWRLTDWELGRQFKEREEEMKVWSIFISPVFYASFSQTCI